MVLFTFILTSPVVHLPHRTISENTQHGRESSHARANPTQARQHNPQVTKWVNQVYSSTLGQLLAIDLARALFHPCLPHGLRTSLTFRPGLNCTSLQPNPQHFFSDFALLLVFGILDVIRILSAQLLISTILYHFINFMHAAVLVLVVFFCVTTILAGA